MKKLLLSLMLVASNVYSQTIGLHTVSIHDISGYNGNNYGIYLKKDNIVAGTYYNSDYRQSSYVLYENPITRIHRMKISVLSGAITGYNSSIVPILIPSIVYNINQDQNIRATIAPALGNISKASVIHFSYEYKL